MVLKDRELKRKIHGNRTRRRSRQIVTICADLPLQVFFLASFDSNLSLPSLSLLLHRGISMLTQKKPSNSKKKGRETVSLPSSLSLSRSLSFEDEVQHQNPKEQGFWYYREGGTEYFFWSSLPLISRRGALLPRATRKGKHHHEKNIYFCQHAPTPPRSPKTK